MDKATLIAAIKKLTPEEAKDVRKALGVDEQASKADSASMNREQLEHQRAMSKALKDTAEAFGNITEANRHHVDLLKHQAELQLDQMEMTKEARAEAKNAIKDLIEYGDTENLAFAESNKELKKIIDQLEKEAEIKRGIELLDKTGITVHKDIAKSMGLRVKAQDTMLGQLGALGSLLSENKEKQAEILAGLRKQVLESIHYKTIAASVFTAIKDNSIALFENFDKAQASLAAATGQGQEFNDVLYEVGRSTNLYGVSMDEAGKAIGVLVNQTSYFTSLNKATQMEVAKTTAQMERLGVSTADSAAIFQNFNQGLGITASESIKMQRDLAMAGVDIGISAQKITKDFNASLGTLMVYGRESINVFKGIAAAAKAAGVETSTLLGVAQKFDTFAGAAEGVGKLNALLGTQLSTTEMLMATEDERIRMLVKSVQAQGVAFQDMDRFTQKAIANSVGITDMAEANRIFGMSLKEYDENERKLNASAAAQEKFEKAVSATVPVMNQFKLLGAEIVVTLQPFFEILNDGAKSLTEFFKNMSTGEKEVLGTFLAGISVFILAYPALKLVFGGLQLAGVVTLPALAAGAGVATPAVAGLGAAMASAGSMGLPFVGALLKISLIIGGVTLAVSALATSFGYLYEGVSKVVNAVSGPFMEIFRTFMGTDKEIAELETRSAEAMAKIITGKPETAIASIKKMVAEVNKMGAAPEVRSTIENLALVTSGQAKDMNGNVISAAATNITTKVNNVFEGMKMTVVVDGYQMDGVVAASSDRNDLG